MTLRVRGGERERLSYRALDVEQIGSVYDRSRSGRLSWMMVATRPTWCRCTLNIG
jgi:hypothetical protein